MAFCQDLMGLQAFLVNDAHFGLFIRKNIPKLITIFLTLLKAIVTITIL
jgi:hypothetical protein